MGLNEQIIIATIVGLILGFLLSRGSQNSSRLLELKVDCLLKYFGIEYDPSFSVPENIVKEAKLGNTVKAIKMYRAHTGCGLKEAKEIIDKVASKQVTNA